MPRSTGSGDALRRAIAEARMRDVDIAAALQVDPKTVQRWTTGRLPQARHRWALADLIGASELELWPEIISTGNISPEITATYDHRSAVPREVWQNLFKNAHREISILVYSGLFIAEDIEIINLLDQKAADGVQVQILLGDPDSPNVKTRGQEEGIGDAMAAKIRNAIVHFEPLLEREGVEIRLHSSVLYNSLFLADDDLMVNQHVFGIAAAQAPVTRLRRSNNATLYSTYAASLRRIRAAATPLPEAHGKQVAVPAG